MKTLILLLSTSILLCSCDTIVSNRDSKGRFTNPPCPTCKAKAVGVASIYLCEKGHKYRTGFQATKSPR